jgi:YHS domain-containing protein
MTRLETTTKPTTEIVIDPVCGMKVDTKRTAFKAAYHGQDYYFCAEGCRREFVKNPQRYLETKPANPRGTKTWWGRYLERVAKANEEIFGGRPPCCHG